jgi:hypothetical protein
LRFSSISIAPSIMSGGGHMRSGSPDPLPVPPRDYKNGYRDDRPYPEPAHHRSQPQRRRDNDRGYGYAHNGEVRFWDVACGYHHRILTCLIFHALFVNTSTSHAFQQISRVIMCHVLSLGKEARLNIPISSSQSVQDAKEPSV